MKAHNKFVKFAQQVGLGRAKDARPLQKRYVLPSMNFPDKNDLNKVSPLMRVLAAFVLLCGFIASAGLVFVFFTEPLELMWFFLAIIVGIMVHASGSVVLTGYAPKYLLFAHGSKQNT